MLEVDSLRTSVLLNIWQGDRSHAISRSIRSIINQTKQPFELVLVIDGPLEPEKLEVVNREIQAARFSCTLVELKERHGLALARNIGAAIVRGHLIAIHDADDVMHPDRLRLQIEAFRQTCSDIVLCQAFEFESESEIVDRVRITPVESTSLRTSLLRNNSITHSSVLICRDALVEAGGYKNVMGMEDYHLWLRLLQEEVTVTVLSDVLQSVSRDPDYLRRRRGLKFARSEFQIVRQLNASANGLQRLRNSLTVALRTILRIVPSRLLTLIYDHIRTRPSIAPQLTLDDFTGYRWVWRDNRLHCTQNSYR